MLIRSWLLVSLALASSAVAGKVDALDQWGQWRGPLGTGVAPRGKPPLRWSETHNVRWKTKLPGRGQSTPIVWGDRVFVTSSVPHGEVAEHDHEDAHGAHDNLPPSRKHRFVVLALDRHTGEVVWQRTAADRRPHEGAHVTGSWASHSAVTDGKRVYASFGSQGLYAYTLDGKPVWQKDLGDMEIFHGHGEGSSPALHGTTLLVNWDHQGESFLVALDSKTGAERWRAKRDEITSWSSPLVVEHAGRHQVVVAATGRVRGYDLKTGEVIWECAGLSRNVVATPVAADGYVYVGNSYNRRAMLAIRLEGASGDITGTDQVVWTIDRDTPYVPSPLLYDGMLYFMKHNQGFLTNLRARTGERVYGPARLDGIHRVFASPVGADGRVYVVDRRGGAAVLKAGATFEVLARNRLDDSFSASPAIVDDALFLRGDEHLYCLAESATPDAPRKHPAAP